MDPDAPLRNMRESIRAWVDAPESEAGREAVAYAAEAADSLDEWLSKGGALPRAWA